MQSSLHLGHYVILQGLEKRADAGAPDTELLDPRTGRKVRGLIRIEGNPEYPQLGAGLEIGAIYQWTQAYFFEKVSVDGAYFGFLQTLGEMVGHNEDMPTPTNPPPFFELLRYGLQRAQFGPDVAEKLKRDFEEWDERARTYGGSDFYDQYFDTATLVAEGTAGTFYFSGAEESWPYEFRQEWVRVNRNSNNDSNNI